MVKTNSSQPGKYHRGGNVTSHRTSSFSCEKVPLCVQEKMENIKLSISETPQRASTNNHILIMSSHELSKLAEKGASWSHAWNSSVYCWSNRIFSVCLTEWPILWRSSSAFSLCIHFHVSSCMWHANQVWHCRAALVIPEEINLHNFLSFPFSSPYLDS